MYQDFFLNAIHCAWETHEEAATEEVRILNYAFQRIHWDAKVTDIQSLNYR